MNLSFKPHKLPLQLRFCDLDGLGHINNANYLSYVELARVEFLNELGTNTTMSDGERLSIILARAELDFLAPATLGDGVYAESAITRIGTKSFDMHYRIKNRDNQEVLRSKAVLVWYDYDNDQSVEIPSGVRKIFEEHLFSEFAN